MNGGKYVLENNITDWYFNVVSSLVKHLKAVATVSF